MSKEVKILQSSFGGFNTWRVVDLSGNLIDTYSRFTPDKPWVEGVSEEDLSAILKNKGFTTK